MTVEIRELVLRARVPKDDADEFPSTDVDALKRELLDFVEQRVASALRRQSER
ncbi:DUF5908 family protein [uncultured Ruegeria sp.]|uniref:DUF5908 family protein n=1 Tax=uncultured Ruegeria sp. TaxID=259304 RepID=UPI002623AA5D|nr:DUF5908 family protein [uncultured Ruegeria sp.]